MDAETRAVMLRLVEALASCHQDDPQIEGRKGPEGARQYYDEDIVKAAITAARNLLDAQPAAQGLALVPVDLIAAFKHQRQCDEEGVEIAVSRQAVCELIDLIAAAGKEYP